MDITPEDENPEFPITELTGPRRGRRLVAANDTPITFKGEKWLKVVTKEGHPLAWPFIAGRVMKTLKSVATICDVGNVVLFTIDHCYLLNLKTGAVIEGDRVGNTYTIEVWVRVGSSADPDEMKVDEVKSGFARPGAAR